jgi:hypothetical protein
MCANAKASAELLPANALQEAYISCSLSTNTLQDCIPDAFPRDPPYINTRPS